MATIKIAIRVVLAIWKSKHAHKSEYIPIIQSYAHIRFFQKIRMAISSGQALINLKVRVESSSFSEITTLDIVHPTVCHDR